MRFTQLGSVAALAGLSQGFLIPTEITPTDKDIITILPFEDAIGLDGRILEIDCPGCPVAKNNGAQSTLQLNFTLSHNNGRDNLMLNELQIYPMLEPGSAGFMQTLTAPQMVKAADETWHYGATPDLGYELSINLDPRASNREPMGLVAIHLEILEVANKFVGGLPTVDLKLLETGSGQLMIGAASVARPSTTPTNGAQGCTTMACRLRAIIAEKLKTMKGAISKGCGKKHPSFGGVSTEAPAGSSVRPVFTPKGPPHHHGLPRPHGPHGRPAFHRGHRHHRHGHGVARFLRGIVLHVFIPVLIGVMVGITASLIGMVVGHIVIFTWRMLFRRGQSSYDEVNQAEADEETDEKSKSFLREGPPPHYEAVTVDEKKEDLA